MKKIYLLVLACLVGYAGFSQTAASYSFSRTTGTFTSIIGGPGTVSIADAALCTSNPIGISTLGSTSSDDGATTGIPLGFSFDFAGSAYTACAAGANGVFCLSGPIGASSFGNSTTNITGAGWFMPLWDDLFGTCRTAYYQTSGLPGSQVFTFEWADWDKFNGRPNSHYNFQVKLFEGSNIIQFIYGSAITAGSALSASIGIANSSSDFLVLPTTASATAGTTFANTLDHPADGDMLQFCPPPTAITGAGPVCVNSTITLNESITGGTWSSSNTGIATVNSSGVVLGLSSGTVAINYVSACGVMVSTTVTVNPLPGVGVTASHAICIGSSTTLNGTGGGGTYTWSPSTGLSATTGATVTATPTITTTYTVTRTNLNGCSNSANVTVTVNPLPVLQNVTGGGNYCSGGTGVSVGLDGSESGVNYQLYDGVTPVGSAVAGTASAISFGLQTTATTYTVTATNAGTGCTNSMTGSATVNIDPLPTMETVTGGGSYCLGGSGVSVGLTPSETGVDYQLYNGVTAVGSPVAGTGSNIDFGMQTGAGTYTVVATNTVTGCVNTMTGSATVVINPLPMIDTIIGGGAYCFGGAGVPIGMTPSETGIDYQLYNGITAMGSPIAGTGTAIFFGMQTVAGTYSVVATNTTTGCTVNMYGNATVSINPLPDPIMGLARVCVGSMITVTDATTGGEWSSSNTSIATVGSLGDVTGVSAGDVNIMYTLTSTGCMVSAPITVDPLPAISGGANVAICYGASTPMNASGGAIYTWSPADGLSCTNCSNPTASPTVTTTYTVTGSSSTTISYSQAFVDGVTPTTQCAAWETFRASLAGTYIYRGFTIKGSENTTGITCTDPVIATAVANALRTGTAYSGSSDGQTWTVGVGCASGTPGCGTVAVELANQGTCSCSPGYSIRPAINNNNWGGIGGNTCGALSQTMEVEFYTDGCTNTSVVTVSVNPLPAIYNVTGGGNYCADGTGVNVGLDTSNGGIRYQLYYGLATAGSPLDGTEAALDFGLQTGAGNYTVMATDTTTGCMSTMNGSATVVIDPLTYPAISIFRSTSDTICDGTHTTFSTSIVDGGTSPHYMWTVNGTAAGVDSVSFDYVPVNGDHISVTLASNAVCARPDTVHSDTILMNVWPNGNPAVTLSASPDDTVCDGTMVTITATPTMGGYHPTYTMVLNMVAVGSSDTYSYIPADGDDLYAIMTSDYMCRLSNTAYSNVAHLTVETPIVPSVVITGRPGMIVGIGKPDTLTATVTNGGTNPTYQWLLNGTAVVGATTSVFIRSSFTNNDSVSCLVTRQDACQLSTINSVVITVANVGVQSTVLSKDGLILMPNPNKGNFTIKGSIGTTANEEVTVDITNMLGQTVYSNKFAVQNGNLDAQIQVSKTLANGMYMLNLHTTAGNKVFHFVVSQ